MKFMYQVPVTETYAIRSQVIMEATRIEGGGPDSTPEVPMD